jgi:hypothetical protein
MTITKINMCDRRANPCPDKEWDQVEAADRGRAAPDKAAEWAAAAKEGAAPWVLEVTVSALIAAKKLLMNAENPVLK